MYSGSAVARGVLQGLWHGIRLPVLGVLVVLEPIVSVVLGGLTLLGLLAVIIFKLVSAPHIPAWHMLGISLGFFAVLVLYQGLIRLLSH